MGTVNRIILVGNLGRDAELRYTGGGTPVANFSMATTEVFKDKDGQKREETEWHRVSLMGKQAESVAEYLRKGKQIYCEGRLRTRTWDDKEGNKRTTTEVIANRVVLLGGGGGGGRSQSTERDETAHEAPAVEPAGALPGDDEVPF
jgi:single-strand DNA-binding protein